MPRVLRVARLAAYLLVGSGLFLTAPTLWAQEPQTEQPMSETDEQPGSAVPDADAASEDAPAEEDAATEEAPAEPAPRADAEAEVTSLDELVAPVSVQEAPSWLQPYFVYLDADQNRMLTAPELEAWRARGEDVMTVIEPSNLPSETFTGPIPSPEIVAGIPDLQWTPNTLPTSRTLLDKAQRVIFRREVWCLEFSFRPLRMLEVDIPTPSGKMERKQVWYMVYRVRYLGNDIKPEAATDTYGNTTYPSTTPVSYGHRRFFPQFVFQSFEYDKRYLDQIIPGLRETIAVRERPPAKLHNSVEMMNVRIPLAGPESAGVWGYVTWTNIDPRADFFAVLVNGLSNAFQIQDEPGGFKPGDPPLTGRQFAFKTLQLNFWRPGDSVEPHEAEIRYGIPVDPDPVAQEEFVNKYGLSDRLDYLWVYR